jgi:hypothetical protein
LPLRGSLTPAGRLNFAAGMTCADYGNIEFFVELHLEILDEATRWRTEPRYFLF